MDETNGIQDASVAEVAKKTEFTLLSSSSPRKSSTENCCSNCKKTEHSLVPGQRFFACSKCLAVGRTIYYCSKRCRIRNSRYHKALCGKPLPIPGAAAETQASSQTRPSREHSPDTTSEIPAAPLSSFEWSEALQRQILCLRQEPTIDYVFMFPRPFADQGMDMRHIASRDLSGQVEEARRIFLKSRAEAMKTGSPRAVHQMYTMLLDWLPFAYTRRDLKKQLESEYGITITVRSDGVVEVHASSPKKEKEAEQRGKSHEPQVIESEGEEHGSTSSLADSVLLDAQIHQEEQKEECEPEEAHNESEFPYPEGASSATCAAFPSKHSTWATSAGRKADLDETAAPHVGVFVNSTNAIDSPAGSPVPPNALKESKELRQLQITHHEIVDLTDAGSLNDFPSDSSTSTGTPERYEEDLRTQSHDVIDIDSTDPGHHYSSPELSPIQMGTMEKTEEKVGNDIVNVAGSSNLDASPPDSPTQISTYDSERLFETGAQSLDLVSDQDNPLQFRQSVSLKREWTASQETADLTGPDSSNASTLDSPVGPDTSYDERDSLDNPEVVGPTPNNSSREALKAIEGSSEESFDAPGIGTGPNDIGPVPLDLSPSTLSIAADTEGCATSPRNDSDEVGDNVISKTSQPDSSPVRQSPSAIKHIAERDVHEDVQEPPAAHNPSGFAVSGSGTSVDAHSIHTSVTLDVGERHDGGSDVTDHSLHPLPENLVRQPTAVFTAEQDPREQSPTGVTDNEAPRLADSEVSDVPFLPGEPSGQRASVIYKKPEEHNKTHETKHAPELQQRNDQTDDMLKCLCISALVLAIYWLLFEAPMRIGVRQWLLLRV